MNPLIDVLRKKALLAMKAKDGVATTILRLAQSEVQALEARVGRDLTDDEAFGALKKLVKSNEETLASSTADAERSATLQREIEILSEVIPKGVSLDAIIEALGPVADAIKAAAGDGQATGVAVKHLKSVGVRANGSDVATAVKTIRG